MAPRWLWYRCRWRCVPLFVESTLQKELIYTYLVLLLETVRVVGIATFIAPAIVGGLKSTQIQVSDVSFLPKTPLLSTAYRGGETPFFPRNKRHDGRQKASALRYVHPADTEFMCLTETQFNHGKDGVLLHIFLGTEMRSLYV